MKKTKVVNLRGVVCPPLDIRKTLVVEWWQQQKDGKINVALLDRVLEARRKKL